MLVLITKIFSLHYEVIELILTEALHRVFLCKFKNFWPPQPKSVSYTHLTLPTNREV